MDCKKDVMYLLIISHANLRYAHDGNDEVLATALAIGWWAIKSGFSVGTGSGKSPASV